MSGPNFADRDGKIWFNGEMVEWRDAKCHVLTHGLHYASAVFEGERMYAGSIFKLREHTERLLYSAGELGFKIPYTADEIDAAILKIGKPGNCIMHDILAEFHVPLYGT